jgi:Ca2+-binding RTX toxin-like protein
MATIIGTKKKDMLNGTTNDDLMSAGLGDDVVNGDAGNDQLYGEGGNDTINGGLGDDLLDGGIGKDALFGGAGRDRLEGGIGNDSIDGGAQTDTAVFAGNRADYKITTVNGVTTVKDLKPLVDGNDGTDTLTNVEFARFADTVVFLPGNQLTLIEGTALNDSLNGTADADYMLGYAGDDNLFSGEGDDILEGGPGFNHLSAGEGNDTLIGGDSGNLFGVHDFSTGDSVQGGTSWDILMAYGTSGADPLLTISGQQGIINGVVVFSDIDSLFYFGQEGNDQVDASAATLDVGLYGREGDDTLIGSADRNELYGDRGNDNLTGGGGNDSLFGGGEADIFVFAPTSGQDVIQDLFGSTARTEHDLIDVQAYGFADWNALQAVISDDVVSGDAVIHLSATDSITLVGVHTADLLQTNFII